MRIGLGLAAWGETAREIAPYTDPRPLRIAFAAAFFLASTLTIVGLGSRFASAATGVVLMILWSDPGKVLAFNDAGHHHNYLLAMSFLLLALTPCGGSYSLDRWRVITRSARAGMGADPDRDAGERLLLLDRHRQDTPRVSLGCAP
jgi:hypothetical protein